MQVRRDTPLDLVPQRIFARQFSDLPDWEQAMVLSVLERVGDMLNAGDIDASPLLDVGAIVAKE